MLKTFAYHKPTEEGLVKIQALREAFSVVHDAINDNAPHSRERSIALTELETSAMWAIKAIVFDDSGSELAT